MQWVSTMFHQGGPTMFWILMLVVPGLALVGVHIGLRRRWSLWTSIGAIALILGIGLYGMMWGRSRVDDAARDAINEQDRAMMLDEGYKEASRPIQLAAVVGGILAVGVVIGQLRKRESR